MNIKKLDNSIVLLTEEVSYLKSATIGFFILTGSKYDIYSKLGMAHFMEHILFKGSINRDAKKIAEEMDWIGGDLNAFTQKEKTCFYAKVRDVHLPIAIDIITDIILNPKFDLNDIENERKVILEEIKMYEDSPDEVAFDNFLNLIWKGHPYSNNILGTKESVKSINKQDLIDYKKKFYKPENIIVSVAGNIDEKEVEKLILEKFFKGSDKNNNFKLPEVSKPEFHVGNVIKQRDYEHVYLIMGTKTFAQSDERRYPLFILDSVLGSSASSRLFQEIREKRGMAYSISTFQTSYKDAGMLGIYSATSKENVSEVLQVIYDILQDIKKNNITKEELDRAKNNFLGSFVLSLESSSSRMLRMARSFFYHNRLISDDEIISKVMTVSLDDIYEIAQNYLDINKYSIAITGPIDNNFKLPYKKEVII